MMLGPVVPALFALCCGAPGGARSNILFVILDDVGADQLGMTNPAGIGLAETPTLDALVEQGVRFTNCWAMPECSPSRVCFFTGRYPFRTGVGSPLTPATLPQSQCSPFEETTPRLLAEAGYASALFGKFHLAQEDYNPFGLLAPSSVGFTHFDGTLLGGPPYIDTTGAGQVTADGYTCGFPVDGSAPATCACAWRDEDGTVRCQGGVPSLACLQQGGIPLAGADGSPVSDCSQADLTALDWDNYNGYFVWPRTTNSAGRAETVTERGHADGVQAGAAVEFILQQQALQQADPQRRWMCTLSFSGDHDPWQPTPPSVNPDPSLPAGLPLDCEAVLAQRQLSDQIIRGLDTHIRRVLLETGLAHLADGALVIDAPDTLIAVIGDNGSFLTTVKAPFDPVRAKATAYQTGVLVPLVIAGGPVVSPGRAVDAMVNCVDLYELWGEAASVDVHQAVPQGRRLDSRPMLAYLQDPASPAVREFNYSEYLEAVEAEPCYPCVIPTGSSSATCTDTFLYSQALCESQGGVWYGPGDADVGTCGGEPCADCCAVYESLGEPAGFSFVYAQQRAITDGRYKLVLNEYPGCGDSPAQELYDLAACPGANVLFGRGIDYPGFDLLASGEPLTPLQAKAHARLQAAIAALAATDNTCTGDVTMDGEVGGADLAALLAFWGEPSVADLNNDATTDGEDLAILLGAWGQCG